jgi:asparagine synthase (glutamine-hydrolysing)
LEEFSERFAAAFQNAVAKRTLAVLGRSAVALSGGLDSRTVLCAAPNRQQVVAFSCYDEENREFRIAKSIASKAGVEFIPLKRSFDYYGDHALLGTRISAGMGCIASNHFLGIRKELKSLGIENLLTGCYCDYLFKGLAVNKRLNRWTTRESLGRFDVSYYSAHFASNTALAVAARQRLEELFPPELRRYDTESAVLSVEQRRMFPLCYEEDNAERTIPQRVMGWYVPVADNGLMEIILSMSCPMKMNRRLFARMVEKVCGENICRIPDANTGAPVNASPFREAFHSHLGRVEAFYRKVVPSNATTGSWLNWSYYARQSRAIQSLWSSPSSDVLEIFRLVLGKDGFKSEIAAYEGRRIYLFLQLFTLKLWFDQRYR